MPEQAAMSETAAYPAAHRDALARAGAHEASVLIIDLEALGQNYRALRERARAAECAAAVKADAYGLGMVPVARRLHELGCRTYFVATIDEGITLRAQRPEAAAAVIYVLGTPLEGDGEGGERKAAMESGEVLAEHGLRPVLNSLGAIEAWARFCQRKEQALPAAVHVDTGMNRLGLDRGERRRLAAEPSRLAGFACTLIMSHLACADAPDHPLNRAQLAAFSELRAHFPDIPASLANSAGVLLGADYHFDLVRPGIALYGGRALATGANPSVPVVALYARILQVREAQAGESVGYGATYRFERPRKLATVACGYADGYFRALSASDERPGAEALLGGHRVPVVGRVSMDLITLDVSDAPAPLCRPGAWVQLLGPELTVDELAERAGTIGYEVLTRLGPRARRVTIG